MKPHLWLIQFIGVIVPRRLRADWRQEWEAELHYRETLLVEWDNLNRKSKVDLLWHSLGAFMDALWLQPRRWEDAMVQDIRYAIRMLAKNPSFTLIVALMLALGIGVNTAIFSLFNIQLHPLPITDPDAMVWPENRRFSFSDYIFFRDQTQVYSGLVACSVEAFLLRGDPAATDVEEGAGEFVSGNYFSVLGVKPVRGRTFTQEEVSAPGKEPVVIISHQLWKTRFGGAENIVGQTLLLNNKPFVVIGVMGRGFYGISNEDARLWLPLTMRTEMDAVYHGGGAAEKKNWFGSQSLQWLEVYGRLKPGRTIQEAQAETKVLMSQLRQARPEIDPEAGVVVGPAQRRSKGILLVMAIVMSATGIVLLIACFNITNLMLAKATQRRKEIGIRLCLGATRRRVMRQLLTESLLLAGLGGVAGLIVAGWCLEALAFLWSGDLGNLATSARLDSRVLAFTFVASLLSGILSGLAPALRATRPDLIAITKDEAAFGASFMRSRLRNGLVIAQVALSLVLLIPAGLLVRGLWRALAIDPGYETKKALTVGYSLKLRGYDDARARRFNQELMDRLKAIPGVQSIILGGSPFQGTDYVTLPDVDVYDSTGRQRDNGYSVSPGFFAASGIQLTRGREFTEEEARAEALVVVISESTARRLWPGAEPIGKKLRVKHGEMDAYSEVVGVARDAQTWAFGEIPPVFAYVPLVQTQWQNVSLLVRTSGDAADFKSLVRATAREIEPTISLRLQTPEEQFATSKKGYLVSKTASQLATALGLLALLLAAIGVHGVMAYSVSQRTREIGIRMALGASRRDALRLAFGHGLRLVGIGAALGLAGGAAISRAISIMFYGLSPLDPITYLSIALLLAVVAALAIYFPARSAATVDPMVALRHE
jgi:putative ABC transport system permease protein